MPKISVIVPVYNVERYLPKCIDSILCQTFRDFEVILVDDGSKDRSGSICDRYGREHGDLVRVIHQENGGLGHARNTGIAESLGEYLLFVDSDDYIAPVTLETLDRLQKASGAELVFFGMQTVTEEGVVLNGEGGAFPCTGPASVVECPEILLTLPTACNKLFRKRLFEESGIRFPRGVWYEDIRTTTKLLLQAEKMVSTDAVLYSYLSREGSITKNNDSSRNMEILEAFEDILTHFKAAGRFVDFRQELEFLAVYHLYVAASVRIIMIDRDAKRLEDLRRWLDKNFPDYRMNPYLGTLGRNKGLVYHLLNARRYGTIAAVFNIKNNFGSAYRHMRRCLGGNVKTNEEKSGGANSA